MTNIKETIRLGSQTTILTDLPNGQVKGRYATDAERKLLAAAPSIVAALQSIAQMTPDELYDGEHMIYIRQALSEAGIG